MRLSINDEKLQYILLKISTHRIHGLTNQHPDEELHHIEADRFVKGSGAEKTQYEGEVSLVPYVVWRVVNVRAL
jgi:hypothetical protein